MIITYHGGECIRASAGETTLVFGPVSKQSKNAKPTNFGADIAFISLNHPDMNGADEAGRGDKKPFIVAGPGEYEISGITVHGFQTQSEYGGERKINTIYYLTFDGMHVLYLGALADGKLPNDILEEIEEVDLLFTPIGGDGVLSPAEAHKLAVQLEAHAVIPIHWDGMGVKDALKQFLKEAGREKAEEQDKLTVKSKDTAAMTGEVIVLKA